MRVSGNEAEAPALYKNSLDVSNVQLGLRTTDRLVGLSFCLQDTHTHLHNLLYLSSQAPDTYYTIGEIVLIFIVLIFITKCLVGALEFRMEL